VGDLVTAWSGEPLRVYPVSTRVNAVRNDDPELCEPVEPADEAAASTPSEPTSIAEPPSTADLPIAGSDGDEHAAAEEEEPVQARLF
jgi:hypothetical protein